MFSNIEQLDEIIVGRVEPHIYAFTTNTIPNYLKVGDTYRPVSVRLEEWRTYYKNLKKEFEKTAKVDENVYFRDYAIHSYLENILKKERLNKKDIAKEVYFSKEFFKDTKVEDLLDAIEDIKSDYKNRNNIYQFYNASTTLPEEMSYASVGYLNPRKNQEEAIKAFTNAVAKGRTNLLMYAVMRFGKSFTAMCCAKEAKKIEAEKRKVEINKISQFVVVVSAKANVKEEWEKTIKSIENFKDYDFLTTKDLEGNNCLLNNKNIVLFLTLQDLQGKKIKERHRRVFEKTIDLLIIDETHFGARADKLGEVLKDYYIPDIEKTEKAIKILKAKIKLHLSGTPYRILMGSEFKKEDIIAFVQYSDIVNEQEKWDKENLLNDDRKEWENPYYGFPQMIRFAFNPNESSMRKLEELRKHGISYAFSELFKTKSLEKQKDNSHEIFINEKEILELFEVIDGSKEDKNLLGFLDYNKLKEGNMCRHIVCVLPYCASCDALEKLIKDNKSKFKNLCEYKIINISGINKPKIYNNNDKGIKYIKKTISDFENNNKKTITLTVNRMLTGSTVEQWDTMLYFKDTSSPQEYDQAIFRLQNPYVKTVYNEGKTDSIKYNMKPQTLLVDFAPNRMFKMQELKSQIYNVNVDKAGNKKLKERIKEELRISPIIKINENKIKQIDENDVMEAVINYSKDRGIAEETNDIPVDLSLQTIPEIWDRISKENELGSKLGFEIKANEGEESDIEISDLTNEPDNKKQNQEQESSDEKDNKLDPAKKFRMYYARMLYFAFLTKDKVESIEGILDSINDDDNNRIFTNLHLEKNVLSLIKEKMDKLKLSNLDFSIQRINKLARDPNLKPIERVIIANKKFGKLGKSQVVTPENITINMINSLPSSFFKKCVKDKKCILDIASKEGEFAIAIYNKFISLGYRIDEIKDLVYSIPTSSIAYEFTRKIYEILGLNIDNIACKFNTYDLLEVKNDKNDIDYNKIKLIINQKKKFDEITIKDNPKFGGYDSMKFDAIVGNPPYQLTVREASEGNNKNTVDIYQNFQELSLQISNITCLIYPAKDFQRGKKNTLDRSLISLRVYNGSNRQGEKHIPDEESVFGDNVRRIPGDVGVFYYNKDKNKQSDLLIYQGIKTKRSDKVLPVIKEFLSIAQKLEKYTNTFVFSKIKKVCESNFVQYHKSSVLKDEVDRTKPAPKNYSKVLTNDKAGSGGKSRWYYIKTKDLDRQPVNKFKIILPSARPNEAFANSENLEILKQDESFGRTKICIYDADHIKKVKDCQKYLSTKFAKAINMMTPDKFLYYLPDFDTIYNSINWNKNVEEIDRQLYKKYKLTRQEINFIESTIKTMK